MSDGTHIEWTDATWNPTTGCSVYSAGCTNCYAMKLAGTRLRNHPSRVGLTATTKAGPVWNGKVRFNEQWLDQPIGWRRPRKVFVCAHSDLFHESVPDDWIDRIFAVMALSPQHIFQVLTKRADRMRRYMTESEGFGRWGFIDGRARQIYEQRNGKPFPAGKILIGPLPHIWLGVSVENQAAADERIPALLATPAAVRWISAEPLLGPIDLTTLAPAKWRIQEAADANWPTVRINALTGRVAGPDDVLDARLNWVVAGGESGPGSRPMHPDWARSLRTQCADARVPFLFKQWGEFSSHTVLKDGELDPPMPMRLGGIRRWEENTRAFVTPADDAKCDTVFAPGSVLAIPQGKGNTGRELDGVIHDGYPT